MEPCVLKRIPYNPKNTSLDFIFEALSKQYNMKTTNEKPKCEDTQCPLIKDATLQTCPKCGAERPTL